MCFLESKILGVLVYVLSDPTGLSTLGFFNAKIKLYICINYFTIIVTEGVNHVLQNFCRKFRGIQTFLTAICYTAFNRSGSAPVWGSSATRTRR